MYALTPIATMPAPMPTLAIQALVFARSINSTPAVVHVGVQARSLSFA
jgi:hypothetical protein